MEILASADALRFLAGMWDVVERELPPEERIGHAGLAIDVFEMKGDWHAAVVTMPRPQREFEAFFVALIANFQETGGASRVFSLVMTSPPVADPEAAILEWNAKGEYEFIEQRADVEPGAFVDAIEAVLARGAQ